MCTLCVTSVAVVGVASREAPAVVRQGRRRVEAQGGRPSGRTGGFSARLACSRRRGLQAEGAAGGGTGWRRVAASWDQEPFRSVKSTCRCTCTCTSLLLKYLIRIRVLSVLLRVWDRIKVLEYRWTPKVGTHSSCSTRVLIWKDCTYLRLKRMYCYLLTYVRMTKALLDDL